MDNRDIIFGLFVTDDLTLEHHRASVDGVKHRHHITPLDPEPGDDVIVHVMTRGAEAFEQAALIYTTDDSIPIGSRGSATNGTSVMLDIDYVEWDPIIWDYTVHWQGIIPGQPDGTVVQYIISAWSTEGHEVYADMPNLDDTLQHTVMQHFNSISKDTSFVDVGHFLNEHVFSYHVDTFKAPSWAENAVIYHVFIDRFYPGDDADWIEKDDLNAVIGGTLWGVRDKLDYIADLGATCIWLSPTWESPSWHGYDIVDYRKVSERMGGEDALRAVIDGAHQRGMRVLLDMACNHVSNQHPYFLDSKSNPDSPYRDWFFFDERMTNGYKSFFGVETMPRINLNHPDARDWMVENAVMWVRDFDIDGYRLDVADGPGPNFWSYYRRALREVKSDVLIFGEIIDIPNRLRTYVGRLDGCLDFPLTHALRRTYAHDELDEKQLEAFIRYNDAFYPPDFVRPTFIDNHDMNRFSYIASDDDDRLKRAATRQLSLPGPTVIYYGTEVNVGQDYGVHEKGYYDIRRLMLWGDDQDKDMLAFYKDAIQQRKETRQRATLKV